MTGKSTQHPGKGIPGYLFSVPKVVVSISIIISTLLFSTISFADNERVDASAKLKGPTWFLDTWSARDGSGMPGYTMMFVEVTPNDLVFVSEKSKFIARYHVEIVVMEQNGTGLETRVFRDSIIVDNYHEIASYQWNRLFRVVFEIPDGEYKAILNFVDESSEYQSREIFDFVATHQENGALDVSDILIARKDEIVDVNPDESTMSILPYPAKVFGVDQDEAYCYFEFYPDLEGGEDSIKYRISYIDPDNREEVLNEVSVPARKSKYAILQPFYTRDFSPGIYKVLIQVYDAANGLELERSNRFIVYQSPIDLRFKPYAEVLDELQLIAPESEILYLESMDSLKRQAALFSFWNDRDPTPETELNEVMEEFYRRVSYSRRNYARRGSNVADFSDRGKVYVLFGAPDQIVRENGKSYDAQVEQWLYTEKSMKVIFRDEYGFGSYRLVAPYSLLEEL